MVKPNRYNVALGEKQSKLRDEMRHVSDKNCTPIDRPFEEKPSVDFTSDQGGLHDNLPDRSMTKNKTATATATQHNICSTR